MRTSMVIGLSILLLFSIFLLPTSAMTAGNTSIGTTLIVNDISPNVDVLFIMNNGSPIFSKPDSEGKAKYLPLVEGTLLIEAIQNGNIVDTLTINVGPKVTKPSSGSSGGGSTGIGVSSKEPSSNVARFDTNENDFIGGEQVKYQFTDANIAIYQLLVTGKSDENKISIRVESLNGISNLAKESAPGNVYENVNIWSGSSNIEDILVKFRVENTWIESNNVALSDIRLSRYDQEEWIPLETTKTLNDSQYTYFEANTTGLPTFAISSITGSAIPTGAGESDTSQIPEVTEPQENTEKPITKSTETPGFGILLSILGIFVIYITRKTIK